jgi:tetratricopeptide (TPR) repeat protein
MYRISWILVRSAVSAERRFRASNPKATAIDLMKSIFFTLLLIASHASFAAGPPSASLPAPLFDGLGNLHHPVSTPSAEAQRYFDQGLTLAYAFNHAEAIRSFEATARLDPSCAMAFWGIAYASGPHVNKPMDETDHQRALEALRQAQSAQSTSSQKERAYLAAMAKRYEPEFAEDRSHLDRAYADAMREVAREYPDDLDAQVLLAEALMNTMPWDYWLGDRSPKPETEEAIAALRHVMLRNPDHPGANHLFIHAVEAGPNPELGLPAADRLLHFAPQAGHLVHMPSHIYMRVGQYHEASRANELAVAADRSYVQTCRAQGFYPGVYYPHNVHFLWWATLFEGRSADAMRAARQVANIALDAICGPTPVLEAPRFRHLPWLTSARFGRWDEILAVSEPPVTNSFLVDRVMWHYTRGLALAARKQADPAAEQHARMVALLRGPDIVELDTPYFPATGILKVAEHVLAARVAQARGDLSVMIAQFDEAVAAEDALPYMEPAFWSLPTRQSYGAALLQAGESARAEAVFRQELERFPRNGWSLFGLEQALRAQGRTQAAESVHREWQAAWKHADVQPNLAWF